MPVSIIKDGNTGNTANVTANNRLAVAGILVTLNEIATETGDTYNLNSALTSLTTSNESALFYIKNNEDNDLLIDNIIINIRDYVGTDGQPNLRIYRAPTGGTIVSTASECNKQNRNFGSSKTLDVDCFQGVEGSTLTGQSNIVFVPLPTTAAVTLITFPTLTVLPKGATMGVSYEPPSGITSVNITIAINTILNGSQL